MEVLTQSEIEFFETNGYLHYQNVFPKEVALKMQNEIWEELKEEFDINKNDLSTWRTPPHSPRKAKFSPLNEKIINAKFRSIINDLIGINNWTKPNSWGGFLLTFPTTPKREWDLSDKLWHWDYELFRGLELKGLVIFSFYSVVPEQGGGTLVVKGSHKALEQYYNKLSPEQKKWKHGTQRKHFMKTHPYFADLTQSKTLDKNQVSRFMDKPTEVDGISLQVLELTGNPGDVVFCHPRLVHAPAGINLNDYPRFMRTKFLW